MKILLLELSGSDSVSRSPSKYGGAGITLRRLAENIDDCYLAAEASCFEGDISEKCIPINKQIIEYIRNQESKSLTYYEMGKFDAYVYCNPSITLQTGKLQICWAVGANESINPEIKYLLLHNAKWQQPIIKNFNTKIHEFVLGIDIPPFEIRNKQDIIFECSNHYPEINSHILANWCRNNKITVLLAGPISKNYEQQFLHEIDYQYTFYLGQIKEEEKIKILKIAKGYAGLWSHAINGPTLGVKQALAYQCFIISTPMGIMSEIIQNEINGFLIKNEQDFMNAWNNRNKPDQLECWNTAQKWSLTKMVDSFKNVIYKIMNENL